jgi:prepilin-type N-terminal cleavage/methylation domain-containing protein
MQERGFTLIETLVLVVVVGILAAIAAHNLAGLLTRQELRTAADEAFQALQTAKRRSTAERRAMVAAFRVNAGEAQWAVYPASGQPIWQNFLSDPERSKRITFTAATTLPQTNGSYQVNYTYRGWVDAEDADRQLTLGSTRITGSNAPRYCVQIRSLLGFVTTASDSECG